jgi:ribonucleoside-diphosphate reductase alpha chain
MTARQGLPNRRASLSFNFECGPHSTSRPFRIFRGVVSSPIGNGRAGSDVDAAAKDSAVVASLALQHGVPVETLRKALLRDATGRASSPLGAALDLLENPLVRLASDWERAAMTARAVNEVIGGDDERLAYMRRLLDPNVSLERAYHEINQHRRDGAAQSTIEALMLSLRSRGVEALGEPNTLRRIDDSSSAQLREVLARLIKLRPRYPVISDDLLFKLGNLL